VRNRLDCLDLDFAFGPFQHWYNLRNDPGVADLTERAHNDGVGLRVFAEHADKFR
jgi:hypothetical protein